MSARQAIFSALYAYEKKGSYIEDELLNWGEPDDKNRRLARQVASGVIRRDASLTYLIHQLQPKLKISAKAMIILKMAIYQHYFMDRVPDYAIISESIVLAKKLLPLALQKLLYALLKKMEKISFSLPQDDSSESLVSRLSYPLEFIQLVTGTYGLNKTKYILNAMNSTFPTTFRVRKSQDLPKGHFEKIGNFGWDFYQLTSMDSVSSFANLPNVYIQNPTPAYLFHELSKSLFSPPLSVLDLCAAPGGKTLMAAECFEKAKIVCNDISSNKIALLKSNIEKYDLPVQITNYDATEYPDKEKFDLIILDAPCSNSGVLNKRVEARWRLTEQNMTNHTQLQKKMLQRAIKLLSDQGVIFYLTCSIIPFENEKLMQEIALQESMKVLKEMLILPDEKGMDGGFGCALIKKH